MTKTALILGSWIALSNFAFASGPQKICSGEYADEKTTETVSYDAQKKQVTAEYSQDGTVLETKTRAVKYSIFTKDTVPSDLWDSRIAQFEKGASSKIDLSGAFRIEKINSPLEGIAGELWLITEKNGKLVNVLSTIDIGEYYVCP